ncbi:unnamed protein product, partial [Closterium sp. NIES-54]
MPKERQVAASISTKGEAVGSSYGTNGRAKEIESKKCNLGGTSKLGEHKESGAAAPKQHKGEENPKAAAEEEYGKNVWGTIASVAFSNPTLATGECDWLTLHRRMGHVALPILQQLVKDEIVAGIRVKGGPDEVLGCPTCMQAKFTRYPFSSSEAAAKAPLDEVVMDVVGPLKLGAAGAECILTIVDVYTRMTWVYRVTHCTCSWTGHHLATFICRPGSSLYTLTTLSPPDIASGQVAASSQVFAAASRSSPESAPCLCHPLSHETLLWNHRLGHPSLPRLRGMAFCTLFSSLPRSLPPLPPRPAPTCVRYVECRQRTAPHSSTFPPTEAPLQTLHMDMWGPAQGVNFPPTRAFCRSEGIRQTFTLPASPQENGIAERCIGMVMDVVRTSMIHAAAPHFLWPFAVQYATHQIYLQHRVSLRETTPIC